MISAETSVAAVIGDPVSHSLSPVLHNAAYRELGLDWVYVAFRVPEGGTGSALDAARALGLVGLSVTMPHKSAAAGACDELTGDAAALHSVNTVTPGSGGRLLGESTDGEGFLRSLRDAGHDPAGVSALVLGAGGAGRAVALALGRSRAQVTVCARRPEAARLAADLAHGRIARWDDRANEIGRADLVVNATSVGLGGADRPAPTDTLHPGQVVADLVYHPIETPFLVEARARGAATVDGLGMLVHQAALQVERWTGCDAPVAVMRSAVAPVLGETR